MTARALVLASLASGAGKTTLASGLMRAAARRGFRVAAAKSGPDYLDPQHHAAALGRASINLDAFAMPPDALRARALAHAADADFLIIEGAMGLFDGAATEAAFGPGATADVAAALAAPVVLILDIARQGQSVAALALGAMRLRTDLRFAGALLNRAGSARHAALAARAVESVGLPCLGAIRRSDAVATPSRHLGLVQPEERAETAASLEAAADLFDAATLDRLLDAARPLAPEPRAPHRLPPLGQRVAVAADTAFRFAYPHHLDDWRAQGAEILPFSPLADEAPDPRADAVFLPGGYPELHVERLSGAARFRDGVRAAAAAGARVYGECGGYMTLGRALTDACGRVWPMLGLLPVETSFAARRLHLGYRRLRARGPGPFAPATRFFGHEFHYASVIAEDGDEAVFDAEDAAGRALGPIGRRVGGVMGSFAHVIS